ncbi:MAG TPA: hypothetical protein VNC22_21565 [Sporichthya sp.]|nr:hypothetical protein [Sporichthya sp.]
MIVFLWWSLSIAAALGAGACGGVIYANYRIRVVAEEVRITTPGWLAPERADLTHPEVAIAVTREVLREEEPKGRHHIGVAIGTRTQRAGWNTPTHQFHALIGATWSAQERADLEEAVA